MPFLQGMPATIHALQALVRYATARRQGIAALPALTPAGREALDDAALERILPRYGLRPPRSLRVATVEAAAQRAAELGFPVALKLLSPQALHKTEIGGVALGLGDGAAVAEAATAMVQRLRATAPAATVAGFLLQQMVSGVELILGAREDAQYGPVLLAGLGGVAVEALGDVALRLLPVDEAGAREMLTSLRGRALLGAFRGRPARDLDAAAQAIAGLSRLFLDQRASLADLEINPLILGAAGEGAWAVDVRYVPRPASGAAPQRSAR
jgi:succinyl-CoA synthetase beta subunit